MSSTNRRNFLKACGAVTAAGAASLQCGQASPTAQPHIILCMADDQGWHETGYYNHPWVLTPVLDEMAANGLRFDNFHAGAPVCTPTRASFITGRHPNRSGVFLWNYSTRPEEISIAHLMQQAGYATAHFGKWHLGSVKADSPVNPNKMGFDYYLSHDNFFSYNPPFSENGAAPRIFAGESSEVMVEQAQRFISDAAKQGKPTFTVLWFGSPHEPYSGTDADLMPYLELSGKKYNPKLRHRYAEITSMDRAMGNLRNFLDAQQIRDNTLLWFCSDNGAPNDGSTTYSPLRGSKGTMYEGGLRVPAIIEWPARIPQPIISNVPSVTSDILPTLCDLLDIPLPDRPYDGISLAPILAGNMSSRPDPIFFWEYDWKKAETQKHPPYIDPELQKGITPTSKRPYIQFLNYRFPQAKTENFGGTTAVLDNQYKLVEGKSGKLELFDIVVDRGETKDLAAEHPDILHAMEQQLRRWQTEVEQSLSGADY
jgi:arylsulfatase A-like enzyme